MVTGALDQKRTLLAALAIGGALASVGCKYDLTVDNATDNPGISPPSGIIQGTASYYGPGPCVRNGRLEGALVVLVFNFLNPPPPEGLATTAVTFATVPSERLFQGLARPTGNVPGGNDTEWCPPLDGAQIQAATQYTISQLPAGHYQLRAFFSRQNKFYPLFDFAQLPLSGDAQGGALTDPSSSKPSFIHVKIGVPVDPSRSVDDPATPLKMPETGFFLAGVPVVVGQVLKTGRPYFHIDYANSRSFLGSPDKQNAKDITSAWPKDGSSDGPHAASGYDTIAKATDEGIVFPQDHPITSNQKIACATVPGPACDIFEYAQTSLPQIHFRYGFPGNSADPTQPDLFGDTSPDAWIAKSGRPSSAFAGKPQPFYGIDPLATELAPGTALPPEANKFVLSRNFTPEGAPGILVDNDDLKTLALIADLFPQVVLAKLAQNADGTLVQPIQPQSDPIVVVQGFSLRGNTMKATSEGDLPAGGLSKCSDPVNCDPKQTNPLHFKGGEELVDDFTAMIRPAALCISPHDPNLRGTLVAPYEIDPNPNALIPGSFLVTRKNITDTQPRVANIDWGCLPAGLYSINVIYPSGQAWTTPNLMGECSFTVTGRSDEQCMRPPDTLAADVIAKGFALRPYLVSQMIFATTYDPSGKNPDGVAVLASDGQPKPLVVKIAPSQRCNHTVSGVSVNNPVHEDLNHNGVLDPGEDVVDKDGNPSPDGVLEMSTPDVCMVLSPPGAACIADTQCITRKCASGKCQTKAFGDDCTRNEQCDSVTCNDTTHKCDRARSGVPCAGKAAGFCAAGCDAGAGVCK